jgi:hypothetical protein
LQIIASASLTGCAAPGNDESAGGPSFIQMPGESRGLVGATPQYLSAAFGQPAILRVDGTAQVWLYHAGDCGLNLILYPDSAGTPRVAMAAPTDDGADINACSAALARAHVAAAGAPLPALAQPLPAAIIPAAVRQPAAAPVVLPAGAAGDGLERASSS